MRPRPTRTGTRQRGAALLIMVLLLMMGVASAGLTFYSPSPAQQAPQHDRTGVALATVKQALIGYASQRGLPTACSTPGNTSACAAELTARPGELPCPDTNNDGIAEASCANVRLGRVPWKTLGIPEPKDQSGETLWYAVSFAFLDPASNPVRVNVSDRVYGGIINSSTVGDIQVRASDGSVITTQAAAVIIAPGVAINAQNRSTSAAAKTACAPGEPADFRDLCRANYLESTSGVSNASMTGPYIAGIASPSFNDRLIYLTAADIIPVVESRVGTELKNLLLAYYQGSKCRCFPWADSWEYSGGIADVSLNRGRFPAFQVKPVDWGVDNADNKIPPLPNWLTLNDWHNIVYYSAGRAATDPLKTCYYCSTSPTLTVYDDASETSSQQAIALIFTPGLPRNGRLANSTPATLVQSSNHAAANDMRGYLDDALNYNKYVPGVSECPGWNAEHAGSTPSFGFGGPPVVPARCDRYVRPSSRAYDRDRLHMISQCSADAYALLKIAPCKDNADPTKVSLACSVLVASLQMCGCGAAATALTVVPCLNTLNSSNCDAPIAQLKICAK